MDSTALRSPIFTQARKFGGHGLVPLTEFLAFTFIPILLGSETGHRCHHIIHRDRGAYLGCLFKHGPKWTD